MKKKALFLLPITFLLACCTGYNNNANNVKSVSFLKSVNFNGYKVSDLFNINSATLKNESFATPTNSIVAGENGVLFEMAPNGSSITYKNLINLKEVNGDLIRFFCNLTENGFKFTSSRVTVTDAYNPNVYFSVEHKQNGGVVTGYWKNKRDQWKDSGCLNTFVSVIYMGNQLAIPNYDPVNYPNQVVAWDQCFYCFEEVSNFVPLSFGFDTETNTVEIQIKKNERIPLFDLDDPTDDYPDFPGFTTGEVYVKVETTGSGGSILLNKIGNDNFTSISENLFKKNTGNLLVYGGIADHQIIGAVNNRMPLPDFSYSKNEVDAKLFKLDPQTEIPNPDFNDYYPQSSGNYKLVLSNKNDFNVNITKEYPFTVNDVPTEITELGTKPQFNVKIREIFNIPEIHYSGGNGDLSSIYSLIQGNEVTIVLPGSSFSINKKGIVSKLSVIVFDEIGQSKSFDYPINVDYNYFYFQITESFDEISVVKNDSFRIPDYVAIDYSKEGDCLTNNVNVSIRQGLYTTVYVGDYITITSDTFIYYCNGNEVIDTIKIHCAPQNLSLEDQDFILNKHYTDLTDFTGIKVNNLGSCFIVGGSNATLIHPYKLSATNLDINFALLKDHSFDSVTFTLKSLGGRDISVTLTELGAKPQLYINGVRSYANISAKEVAYMDKDDSSMFMANYYQYNFGIDASSKSIYNSIGKTIATIDSWSNGEEFNYFEKGCCQLITELKGGVLGDKFILTRLSNQNFNSVSFKYGDYIGPSVAFEKPMKTQSVAIGDSFLVPQAFAYDVFDSNSSITMSIYDYSGNLILGPVNANEYLLDFDYYGQYTVEYRATDSKKRSSSPSYSFYVTDLEAPVITIGGAYQQAYYDGVTILGASVTDNYDKELTLHIWLVDSTSRYTSVVPGQNVVLSEGLYSVIYYCSDSSGNIAMETVVFYIVKR